MALGAAGSACRQAVGSQGRFRLKALRLHMKTPTLALALVILIWLGVTAGQPALRAQEAPPSAAITAPRAGDVVIGLATITGTADHPDLQRYRLEFALQDSPDPLWLPIADIAQHVTDSVLAQWDTTAIPDAVYQIRLRVILRDGSVIEASVQNLTVLNAAMTPLPTAPIPATPLPALPGPEETGSAPLIEMPATSVPLPTLVPVAEVAMADEAGVEFVLAVNALQAAFCNGAYLSIGGFVLLGLYRLVSARLRPQLRRLVAEARSDEE